MYTTQEDNGILNNYAVEPKMTYAIPHIMGTETLSATRRSSSTLRDSISFDFFRSQLIDEDSQI